MAVSIPRIYAGPDGESHFDTVEVALAPVAYVPTNPPLDLSAVHPSSGAAFCRMPTGWDGSRHVMPRRQLVVMFAGTVAATVSDDERRQLEAGDIALLDDHTGRATTPLRSVTMWG